MYISLIDKLSDLDKKRINNYLTLYGTRHIDHLDATEWLEQWSHSKQRLYHALGDKLIVEIPTKIEKSDRIIDGELSEFRSNYLPSFREIISDFCTLNKIAGHLWTGILSVMNIDTLKSNKFGHNIKITLKNGSSLQLQEGMKVMRVLNKIIDVIKKCSYYSEKEYKESVDVFIKNLKQFENAYSVLLNEKFIKGTLCFSIHPLDFMTMSDNSLRWSSCMSWTDNGCYRIGTIEMMNSNNTICAYIKSGSQIYNFNIAEKDNPEYCWNNKKWRQLFYATKDILCCGKSYPFTFDKETQISVLTALKNVITENVGWDYDFGPELYQDMIHIHSKYRMDNNRSWITFNETKKHNILFDTKGMYNDMLNDTNFKYYCYRNKVKHNKIISVSGKANCICCNKSALRDYSADTHDYNERYLSADRILCKDCWDKIPSCVNCHVSDPTENYVKLANKNDDSIEYCCTDCFNKFYRICPFCGEIFNFDELERFGASNAFVVPVYGEDYDTNMTRILMNVYW